MLMQALEQSRIYIQAFSVCALWTLICFICLAQNGEEVQQVFRLTTNLCMRIFVWQILKDQYKRFVNAGALKASLLLVSHTNEKVILTAMRLASQLLEVCVKDGQEAARDVLRNNNGHRVCSLSHTDWGAPCDDNMRAKSVARCVCQTWAGYFLDYVVLRRDRNYSLSRARENDGEGFLTTKCMRDHLLDGCVNHWAKCCQRPFVRSNKTSIRSVVSWRQCAHQKSRAFLESVFLNDHAAKCEYSIEWWHTLYRLSHTLHHDHTRHDSNIQILHRDKIGMTFFLARCKQTFETVLSELWAILVTPHAVRGLWVMPKIW